LTFCKKEYSNLFWNDIILKYASYKNGDIEMDFRGNQWYKCDLHLHTPESKCFVDRSVTAKEWVQACLDEHLEVVAVTDHNSGHKNLKKKGTLTTPLSYMH
jgi:hypothetical protein